VKQQKYCINLNILQVIFPNSSYEKWVVPYNHAQIL